MNTVAEPGVQRAGGRTAAPPPGSGYLSPRHDAVAGRVRFRVAALYRNEDLKSLVTIRLAALPGVRAVRINVLTGSLLIHYDPTRPLPALTAAIEQALAGLPLAPAASRPEPQERLGGYPLKPGRLSRVGIAHHPRPRRAHPRWWAVPTLQLSRLKPGRAGDVMTRQGTLRRCPPGWPPGAKF